MTLAEAEAAAAREGLVLVPSSRKLAETPFKNVRRTRSGTNPYRAYISGSHKAIGNYTSAAEAALAYARYLGPTQSRAEAAAATPGMAPMSEEEAERLATAEGLTLVRSRQ
jgi:hypothetical protein